MADLERSEPAAGAGPLLVIEMDRGWRFPEMRTAA
jgi:hypothetical protein